MIVDSRDRESESFLRSRAGRGGALESFSLPPAEFGQLQSTIRLASVNIVLAAVPGFATSLLSLADAAVEVREEARSGGSVRVASLTKVRGSVPAQREQLFVVRDGRLDVFPALPAGFVCPSAAPDPDPEEPATSLWPGSASFARAFGRLRFGSFTGLTLTPGCPDALVPTFAVPLVLHVLRAGGRVVWMPSPSARPARIVGLLKPHVPVEWIRERFRVLSPMVDEPGLADLARVILPLRRPVTPGGETRPANPPAVGPLFPDAHRFLSTSTTPGPALYVVSIEGLKATALSVGVTPNAITLPAIMAAYGRIPKFHGFGYGRADDPIAAALLPSVETVVQVEMVCGRPIIYGVRPQTPPQVLDWPTPDGPYELRG